MCITQVIMGLYIFLLCQLRRPKSNDTLVTMSTPSDQSWFLTPFANKTNQVSLEKWMNLGLGQDIYKMNLHDLVVPENKEVLKKNPPWASLVAQWLRIHLPMLGHGFEPCSRKIPNAAQQLSPCTTTTEPACHSY